MKNPTLTFADLLLPTHEARKCHYDFTCWSVEREPTKEEKKENPNAFMYIENQVFFYKPFIMTDMNGKKIGDRF